ncbi:MAG: aminomethyl-transferring glycine dehydrogenase subunit GcvPB [Candidatus Electryonea clarkiae]|nr:aminomethyl-transferring glycine dehydrogenase subunit GcvPB [Candidatus Electryonea clarkiae]MDP8289122.1 aminomethyl-transferring glycine dehydrogenase subunit GcvPB [Candidatus Electryonea clarkiae]
MHEKLLYELSVPDRQGIRFPEIDVPRSELPSQNLLRKKPAPLPEVSEFDVVRHFVGLSTKNHHVDKDFYPLGSCTMKYNPKVNELVASMPEFAGLHPFLPTHAVQGALQVMYDLGEALKAITGFDAVTLQPPAGASGEMTGLMLMKAYHSDRGDTKRRKIIIPDSAHGTNPATIAFAGYVAVEVKSASDGTLDPETIHAEADDTLAGLMVTNPNTLGIFERNIKEVSDIVHGAGGLMYMDGANLNALLGITHPAALGFDIMHINLHKTFSTPHGGGGPGSGPVCCIDSLKPFLPVPVVLRKGDEYYHDWDRPGSIGKVHGFYGNFLIMLRALTYILANGKDGLEMVSKAAIVNANYLRVKLQPEYFIPFPDECMHEAVFSADNQCKHGVRGLDIAKRLLDFGLHAPTVYFPLIVHEALMIEPTETESKESLDNFIAVMKQIAKEAEENPDLLHNAPVNTPVRRLDEALAARKPNVRYKSEENV